jgi:tetratricopeptide (TPR) repeat protein
LARYGLLEKALARTPQDRLRAFFVLEKALGMGIDRRDVRRALVDLAMDLSDRDPGRISDARENLEALLEASPGDADLEQRLGRCLEALGDNAGAIRRYEDAIRHETTRVETYERLARLLRNRLRKPGEADRVMDRLVAENVRLAAAYLARWNYRRAYRLPGAAEDANQALTLAPENVRAILAVAHEARGPRGLERALTAVRHGLERHPSDPALLAELADLERAAGKPQASMDWLRRGLGASEKAPIGLRVALVESLAEAGRIAEAETELKRIGPRDVTPGTIEYLRARLRAVAARWVEAARILEDARPRLLTTPPAAEKGLLLLARCYEQLGATDRAVAAYRRVLEINPANVPAALGLAAAHEALGQLDLAVERYRKLTADSPEATLGLVRILILKNRSRPETARDWTEVDRLLDQAGRSAPDTPDWPILRAEALAARGRNDAAKTELADAVKRLPNEVAPRLALARLVQRQGDFEACRSALDLAETHLGDRVDIRLARLEAWSGRNGEDADRELAQIAEGLDRFPPEARRRLLLGLIGAYGQRRDATAVERLARRWGRGFEQDPVLLDARFGAALRAGDNTAMDRALDELRAAESSQGVLWRYDRARRLIARARAGDHGPLVEARALLAEVAHRRPGWSEAARAEAEIEELGDHPEKAIELYRRALERGTRDRDVPLRLVKLLHERRRDAEAESYLHPWLADAPPGDPLRRLAAEVALRTGRPDRAVDRAKAAVGVSPRSSEEVLWLGQVLDAAGRPDEAEPLLRRAVKEAPTGSAEPLIALLRHLVRRGRTTAAEATLGDARPHISGAGASLVLARCEEALGHDEEADGLYRKALQENPHDVATLRRVAENHLRRGRPKEAEPVLRALVAQGIKAPADAAWARPILAVVVASGNPSEVHSALEMAGVLDSAAPAKPGPSALELIDDRSARARVLAVQPGRPKRREAIKILEELGRSRSLASDDRFLLAQLLEREHDWSGACRHLQILAASEDPEPVVLAHYVRDLLRQGDNSSARIWLAKLDALEPQAFEPLALRARLLVAEGYVEDAVRRLEAEARARSDRSESCASVLEDLGRFDAAEAVLRRSAAQPGAPERALVLAKFLGRRNRAGEALDLCAAARPRCRAWAVADAALAVLDTAESGDTHFRRVEAWLDTAIREHPEAPSYLFSLACLRHIEGRYDEAKKLYRDVLRKDPEYGPALNNLAYLLALGEGRAAEAEGLIARAIQSLGPLPQLLDTRAAVYLAMGRHDAAIDDLEEAVEAAPRASRLLHLARAYSRAGDTSRAATTFRRAKDLGLDPRHLHPTERAAYDSLVGGLAGRSTS